LDAVVPPGEAPTKMPLWRIFYAPAIDGDGAREAFGWRREALPTRWQDIQCKHRRGNPRTNLVFVRSSMDRHQVLEFALDAAAKSKLAEGVAKRNIRVESEAEHKASIKSRKRRQ